MYMYNSWYVAAWSRDIDKSLSALPSSVNPFCFIANPMAKLPRSENRCAHRHVLLSAGFISGDDRRVAYRPALQQRWRLHARASQERVPAKARAFLSDRRALRLGLDLDMARRKKADAAKVPDFSRLSDKGFASTGGTKLVRANYELITDNLMDLSHVGFVHRETIGTTEMGEKSVIKVDRSEHGVRVTRWVIDVPAPPTHAKTGLVPTDRRRPLADHRFRAALLRQHLCRQCRDGHRRTPGPSARRCRPLDHERDDAPSMSIRPSYFWGVGRDFNVTRQRAGRRRFIHDEISRTFDEDLAVLELRRQAIDLQLNHPASVDILADAGGVQSRRLLRGLIENEHATESSSRIQQAELAN